MDDTWKEKALFDGARAAGKSIVEAAAVAGITVRAAEEYEEWVSCFMDSQAAWATACFQHGLPEKSSPEQAAGE